MPQKISPQLATLVDKAPGGEEWLHEIKFDGYRILAFKAGDNIKLMSRNNREWTAYFDNVVKALKTLTTKNALFDGEIVLLDKDQHSNFQLLQNALDAKENKYFIYYVFDLIYFEQYNLMHLSLIERKNILNQILLPRNPTLQYSDHIIGAGNEVFKHACKMGLEGIVSKKIDSEYAEKRNKNWLKVKCTHRQEFVIGGYTPPKRSRNYFGSLYLGYFDKNNILTFCGNVGTGFNNASLKRIYEKLQKYIIKENPFNIRPPGITTAVWVKPKLVAEVEFSQWTNEGILRHPSFKGLRTDKIATSINKEVEVKVKVKKIKTSIT